MTNTAVTRPTIDVPSDYRVGHWVVRRLIAAGQFGTVYAAQRSDMDETVSRPHAAVTSDGPPYVAVKFTRSLTEQGRAGLELCRRRDQLLKERGETPWAVTVHEVIDIRDEHLPRLNGASAVVMDLAECNLEDLMGVPGVNVERLLADSCRAIVGMHQFVSGQGSVFHGDLKPSNMLVLEDGSVRIGDLDLIQATEQTHLDGSLPRPGTWDYLPPESLHGDALVRATHDIWAFGVIAHRLLAGGAHPFPMQGGSRTKAIRDYAEGRRPLELDENLQRFPQVWEQVIRDCLQPDRERRRAVTPDAVLDRLLRESRGARQPQSRMPRRPVTPSLAGADEPAPREPVAPRPVRRRAGWGVVATGCALALVAGGIAGAGIHGVMRPEVPQMVVDKAAYGRVQSNSAFGGKDVCSGFRTVGQMQFKSCMHHSEGSWYGGMVIRSFSDSSQRVEAAWGDYIDTGGRPVLDSMWKQELIVGPGDTISVLTTPKVTRETRCVASSGHLGSEPRTVASSPFRTFLPAPCTAPSGWPDPTVTDPPPTAAASAIPGGYRAADCGDTWHPGPAGTGIQFRPCLYHRTDNPNLWNPGVLVRNVSATPSPATKLRLRFFSLSQGTAADTTIAEQDLDIRSLSPTNNQSVAAPYQRWPSNEDGVCISVSVGIASSVGGMAPFRDRNGAACPV